jgi:hypothetical protein
MTQDDIIKLARESGLGKVFDKHAHEYRDSWFENSEYPELLAFAALVADLERDACAKVCEAGINNATDWDNSYWNQCCANRAAAIRARGEQA